MPEGAEAAPETITLPLRQTTLILVILISVSFLVGLWTATHLPTKPTIPEPILSKDDMEFVELNLWVMGYDVGEPDGKAEGKTFDSITQFMKDYCIPLEDDPALLDLPKTTLYHAVITSAHPDWRTIKSNSDFGVWVQQSDRTVRESLDSGDPRRAISVLDQYKAYKNHPPDQGTGTECDPRITIADTKAQ